MADGEHPNTYADLAKAAAAIVTLVERIKQLLSAGQVREREAITLLLDGMTAQAALTEKLVDLLEKRSNSDDRAIEFAKAQVQLMQRHTSLIDGLQERIKKLEPPPSQPPATQSNN